MECETLIAVFRLCSHDSVYNFKEWNDELCSLAFVQIDSVESAPSFILRCKSPPRTSQSSVSFQVISTGKDITHKDIEIRSWLSPEEKMTVLFRISDAFDDKSMRNNVPLALGLCLRLASSFLTSGDSRTLSVPQFIHRLTSVFDMRFFDVSLEQKADVYPIEYVWYTFYTYTLKFRTINRRSLKDGKDSPFDPKREQVELMRALLTSPTKVHQAIRTAILYPKQEEYAAHVPSVDLYPHLAGLQYENEGPWPIESGQSIVHKGRYKIAGELLGRPVAVKVFKSIDGRNRVTHAFTAEVLALSKLRHGNVVSILHYNAYLACIVMPLLSDDTLRDLLKKSHKPLSEKRARRLLLGVAQGLAYLHENKLVHRDVKSENILVDSLDVPVLIDLGLSCELSSKDFSATTSRYTGTQWWMAPEMLKDKRYSYKSDIYSFGIVVWETLSRKHPCELFGFAQSDSPSFETWRKMTMGSRENLFPMSGCVQEPNYLVRLMKRCCSQWSIDRPTAYEAVHCLRNSELFLGLSPSEAFMELCDHEVHEKNELSPPESCHLSFEKFKRLITQVAVPSSSAQHSLSGSDGEGAPGLYRRLGLVNAETSVASASSIFNACDVDGNRQIDWDEFHSLWTLLSHAGFKTKEQLENQVRHVSEKPQRRSTNVSGWRYRSSNI